MLNVKEFKKAVKSLNRKASTIDEFCKEVELYIEASKKKADYQGWTNRPTWAVALWLDNDGFVAPEEITESYELGDYIREMVEENNPLADEANMYSDLMQGVIEEVDYKEIAENIISSRG